MSAAQLSNEKSPAPQTATARIPMFYIGKNAAGPRSRAATIVDVDRDTFRARRARLRPLFLEAFGRGRLEHGGSGGCTGMLFLRLPDGKQFFLGGVNDNVNVEAVVEAVNFALDLCDESRPES